MVPRGNENVGTAWYGVISRQDKGSRTVGALVHWVGGGLTLQPQTMSVELAQKPFGHAHPRRN